MAAGPRSAPSGALAAPLTGSDHRPHEVALALLVALGVQVGATLALRAAALQHMADIREIDPGMEVPIRVRPVVDIDSPLLKLGGKAVKYKLPDQWIVPTPVQRVERRAFASPKADKSPEATPPEDVRMADAGTEPPPPDAAVAKQVDTEVTTPTDAGYANLPVEGSPDGVPEGTETDPLKARAISLYPSAAHRLVLLALSRVGLGPEPRGAREGSRGRKRSAVERPSRDRLPRRAERQLGLRRGSASHARGDDRSAATAAARELPRGRTESDQPDVRL
jgi:hypothetical protein